MKCHSTMQHTQQAETAKLDATNLPVRRSGSEGGKELGYGG